MFLLNVAYLAAAWLALFLLPGMAIASAATGRFRETSNSTALILGFALATHLVPAYLFAVAALLCLPITPWLAAAATAALLLALRRHVRPAARLLLDGARAIPALRRAHLVVAIAAAVAFVFPALFFDTVQGFHFDCIYRPVAIAAGWLPPNEDGLVNYSLHYRDHQRLGVSAVLAPAMALFGFGGLRLLWGALFAVVPLCTWAVARRAGVRRAPAAAAAAVAGLLPWVLMQADQNRVVLSTSALLALTLGLRAPALVVTGLTAGLVFAEEPVAALGLGAVPLVLALHPDARWRTRTAWAGLGAGFAASCAFALARYWMAFHQVAFHEHFSYNPPLPYSLFGADFHLNAFVNWPLHGHLVRSPFNALPNLALVPLRALAHLSLPLAAVALVGIARLAATGRAALALALGAGFLPVASALALLENWIEVEKGDIVIMAYLPVYVAMAAGFDALFDAGRRRLIALAGLAGAVVVLLGAHAALNRLRAPEDARMRAPYAGKQQELPPEDPEYLELERQRTRRVAWWPQLHERARIESDIVLAFFDDLSHPDRARVRAQTGRPEDEGSQGAEPGGCCAAGTAVRLELATPPSRGVAASLGPLPRATCAEGTAAAVLSQSAPGPVRVAVPWNDRPVEVQLHVWDDGAHLVVKRSDVRERARANLPVVAGTCVELQVPARATMFLLDALSYVPTKNYFYRMHEDSARAGAVQLELMLY